MAHITKTCFSIPKFKGLFAGLIFALLISFHAGAAVSLTVSPSVVTNDYVGKITLTISGLSSGQSVRVDKLADLNLNGVIDAGDQTLRSFVVTDGQIPILCGLTNLNVPGDMDGTVNGQIRAELLVPGPDVVLEIFPGKFIFRIANPTNGSLLATQLFTSVQKTDAQGVQGTFLAGGRPLSNSIVGLIIPTGPGGYLVVTDTNGHYLIYAPPGAYSLIAIVTNGFVSDVAANSVLIAPNQFVTTNVTLIPASFTLSGRITDLATGKGIVGISLSAQSTNNLFSLGFTDTNGSYTLPVTTSRWGVKPTTSQPAALGYLNLQHRTNIIVSGASVANVNIQLPKADALIYGTVTDTSGAPVIGLGCSAQDVNDLYDGFGRSLANDGSYLIGVLSGQFWYVGVTPDTLGQAGYVHLPFLEVDLAAGCQGNVYMVVERMNISAPTRLSSSQFHFLVNGVEEQNYTIQTSTNLTAWASLVVTNAPSDSFPVLDDHATNKAQFYRVLVGP